MTHLPYETCLALKEAGFPQDCDKAISTAGPEGYKHFATPNLSELIAELGSVSLFVTPGNCSAHNHANPMNADKRGDGPTPEAACAALYLATKKK